MFWFDKEAKALSETTFFFEFCSSLLILAVIASRYPVAIDADAMKSILAVIIDVTTELLGVFIAVIVILMAIPKRPEFSSLFKSLQIAKTGFSMTISLIASAVNYIGLCIVPAEKSKEFLLVMEFIFIYALVSFAMLIYGCLKGLTGEMSRK